jgi:hypothetical protein
VSTSAQTHALGNLSFPAANINLVVSNNSSPVANSWIGLEQWNSSGGYWEWLDIGTSTSSNGRASLYLPCLAPGALSPCASSSIRVVVNPPWGASSNLPRFSRTLSALQAVPTVSGFTPISFPTSNVNGRVMIDANQANRNGWIEVLSWNVTNSVVTGWVTGSPANRTGQFSLTLDDGTFLLRAHPNGSLAAAPIETIVTVSAGSFVSCSYRTGGNCSSGAINVDLSFANLPKNLEINVTYNGLAITTSALVRLIGAGVTISATTNSTGTILLSVPAGDYSIRVVIPLSSTNLVAKEETGVQVGIGTGSSRTVRTVNVT